eukprot:gnl/MRDRNA2_/MRDRNA2_18166_c0_seq1.p1 gnl/MRDRNA2_/MRDRNA2_18166_c0~~gnl/MRDRNA2_/MRDRNA2_18166_c0_seq1.p1  ORF type:complete len:401 (+),score=60.20 gnl/MRDRNA2_/MRDRNA2_18166_c0_seq1:126-1328(+)
MLQGSLWGTASQVVLEFWSALPLELLTCVTVSILAIGTGSLVFAKAPAQKVDDLIKKAKIKKQQRSGNSVSNCAIDDFGADADDPCIEGLLDGDVSHPQRVVRSNELEPRLWENDTLRGKVIMMHKHPCADEGIGLNSAHFRGRRRLWEVRVQVQFKRRPSGPLYFGVEASNKMVKPSAWTKYLVDATVKLLRTVAHDTYLARGDNPAVVKGELEKPAFVMPMKAFDQMIVSEPGEEPDIMGDLQGLGILRADDYNGFCHSISELDLGPGKTYTFCFWCISRFLNATRWEVSSAIPGCNINFSSLCGPAPVGLVWYELKTDTRRPDGTLETRHLKSLKRSLFRMDFWSSLCRPSADKLRLLTDPEAASMKLPRRDAEENSRLQSYLPSIFKTCCTSRDAY